MENRNKLSTYVLVYDDGAAPNPFGGVCTLAICKPVIRRCAKVGDWVIRTLSRRNYKLVSNDFDNYYVIYAMKGTTIMTLEEYDEYCKANLPIKIPNVNSPNDEEKLGDCIYDY